MIGLARIKAQLSALGERAEHEPVVVANFVGAGLSVAVGVGVPVSEDLKLGVIGLIMGGATVFGRSHVVPNVALVNGEVLPSPAGQAVVIVPAGGGTPLVIGAKGEAP
jgi:hypothetical protein